MRFGSALVVALGLAALEGACGRGGLPGLYPEDAASPGPGAPDADAATPAPGPRDADAAAEGEAREADAREAPAPPRGQRSFVMSSTFRPLEGLTVTGGHSFTVVLDLDQGVALVGSTGGGAKLGLESADGRAFKLRGRASFALAHFCDGEIVYEGMSLTLSPTGVLTGKAEGLVRFTRLNLVETVPVTMTLDGTSDGEPPRLSFASDGSQFDPFWWMRLFASEPLADSAKPMLVSGSGEVLELSRILDREHGRLEFRPPPRLLRFGESYRVALTGVVDFAGNAPVEELSFVTRAPPSLVLEDGFESATELDLGGAGVIDDSTLPVIAGKKSLYVLPGEGQPSQAAPLLLMRLKVQPGDTVIRFSYRTVDVPRGAGNGLALGFAVASVGTNPGWSTPFTVNEPKETIVRPGHTNLLLGPLHEAKLGVPTDATDEIIVGAYGGTATCLQPSPPQQGIIIDDVRVE